MQQKQVRRLPIIRPIINAEDGSLEGILSMNDIALKAQDTKGAELSSQDVQNTLKAICAHRSAVGPCELEPTQEQRESLRNHPHSRVELAAVVDSTS